MRYSEVSKRVQEYAEKDARLAETFDAEGYYLFRKVDRILHTTLYDEGMKCRVLDVGCGDGRSLKNIATLLWTDLGPTAARLVDLKGIDIDESFVGSVGKFGTHIKNMKECRYSINNMPLSQLDQRSDDLELRLYDLVYSSFNTVGQVEGGITLPEFIDRMQQHTKSWGEVVNITWKENDQVDSFMREYYPAIGFKDVHVTRGMNWMRTDDGKLFTLMRPPAEYLADLYEDCGLTVSRIHDVGPLWTAVEGRKR